ncbi:MAG: GTP 3',8-cyclase MoaA [Flexilinea sp.]|nr:GTP 3',8-cyclase MoaA [Flexilinea sp.]
MKDQFNRTIDYLRISVTDRCDFRCRYCMPENGITKRRHADILTLEEIAEIADAFIDLGISKIRLTGGEPLVRKGIAELCRQLKSNHFLKELALTTNGTLLPQYADILKNSGVDRLNISLDTLREDRFRSITRVGNLRETLKGIEAAERAGFTGTKINTVLIGGFNDDEITDLVGLTRDRDLTVRFIELMPIGEAARWPGTAFMDANVVTERVPELQYLGSDGVAELYRLPGAVGTVGLIRPLSHSFCGACSRIRLTADGMLKPCLHSDLEIPLRGLHGEKLISALKDGICRKPARHYIDRDGVSGTEKRLMSEIGG